MVLLLFKVTTKKNRKYLTLWLFFVTSWTTAYHAPPSMGFSRQEYWSGLPFPSPGDLPDPGIKPWSPTLQADSLPTEPPGKPFYCTQTLFSLPSNHMSFVSSFFR